MRKQRRSCKLWRVVVNSHYLWPERSSQLLTAFTPPARPLRDNDIRDNYFPLVAEEPESRCWSLWNGSLSPVWAESSTHHSQRRPLWEDFYFSSSDKAWVAILSLSLPLGSSCFLQQPCKRKYFFLNGKFKWASFWKTIENVAMTFAITGHTLGSVNQVWELLTL